MDSSKFPLPPPQYHSKHDFSFLLNSALAQPELLEDFEKSSQGRTSGRWSKEEHHRFIEGLTKFGKNWKKVEEHIGTRTGAQIRSHAQKFFIRLTKEFKKRVDKDHSGSAVRTGDDYHMDEKKIANPQTSGNNRQRSNSVISNFSNFSLDNASENEEEEKGKDLKLETPLHERPSNNNSTNDIPSNNNQTIQPPQEKQEIAAKNPGLERFLSNVSEKHEDVKNKLIKSQENNEVLKIPTYEKQLSHYQGIIKFFQGLHSYYESGTQQKHQGFLEANEIKQNQSFFDFILKNLEKYVNKNDHQIQENPVRIRKLSDLVVMPSSQMDDNNLKSPFFKTKEKKSESPMKNEEITGRIRKNSFNLCNENETESKKLENLKRKTVMKDVLEKKQKI